VNCITIVVLEMWRLLEEYGLRVDKPLSIIIDNNKKEK